MLNKWKLSTIVLAAVLAGFLLAQVTGMGFVTAQSGSIAKVQLDTSNCGYGIAIDPLPSGAFVVQGQTDQYGRNMYVYNVCK